MKKKSSFSKGNGLHNNKWKVLLIVGILAVISGFFYYRSQPGLMTINEKELMEMLHRGEIKRVVLMKQDNYVKIQLTSKAFYQRKYNQACKELKYLSQEDQHYILKIVSPQIFDNNWKDMQARLKPERQLGYEIDDSVSIMRELMGHFGSILFLLFLLWMFGMGTLRGRSNIFNIGNSQETYFDKENHVNITFDDVKGIPQAKEEMKDVVDCLKRPEKYTRLGARINRGVLLVGPSGCGKTLLAKAVAGEADVPFFFLSGSDFVEMFVGVGASRVRKLFKKAKEAAPCIIFIDEIDAVGRARGKHSLSSNEEGEHTLNALLVEMDGFGSNTNVIVLAATNRPEVLDEALKRPGRFDRQVQVDKPTIKGREEIFGFYLKPPRKISNGISVRQLAEQTPGFTGADIDNVCNRAALLASKKSKKRIEKEDFDEAIEQVSFGPERKDKIIDSKEKNIVAYHEAGHAVSSSFLKYAEPLVKVSIIPRGMAALGYAQYLPKERFIYQKQEMLDRICALLGGRAAEIIFFKAFSTGAQNDLEVATHLAYTMVTVYGMSEEVGPVSFPPHQYEHRFNNPYSEATGQIIDKTVRKLIEEQYQRALVLLKEKKNIVEEVAQQLLQKEVLYPKEIKALIGDQVPDQNTPTVSKEQVDTINKEPEV